MKRTSLVVILFLIFSRINAQIQPPVTFFDSLYAANPTILTVADQYALVSAPTLTIPEHLRTTSLPSVVDNSQTPYMIPIFYQAALECGQASSICYTFSYEIAVNRNYTDAHFNNGRHFPSHFAWNFCNGGTNTGVSFMDTWQIIRTAGSPFLPAWGGFYSTGGHSKWMSGYNLYYEAMQNRIIEMYAIPTNSEEGILTLKHWLDNHLTGDDIGGLANFYSTYYSSIDNELPPGTPEAGKKFLTGFSSYVNHAQTIVGYNDSIRWDYNGDGLYTNNIDINGDGVINVKDWEIGGVKFCNTFGTSFGDQGYGYFSYKRLAELPEEGGIWNSCVYVIKVKDKVLPQITYKATIKHDKRNMIKITAGVASNPNATKAEYTMEFNIFNFQGGAQYMQGETAQEASKTLELGLDVSPLLNHITPDSIAKFFFNVIEKDASGTGTGEIVSFSLMDYTNGSVTEYAYPQNNITIINNDTTTLALVRTVNFTKPAIQDSILPAMNAFSQYSHQLTATGGVAPYRWELKKEYDIEEFTANYPSISGTNVTLSNNSNGYTVIPLNFSFPFFEERYDQIVVYADGYITFRHNTFNWPFLQSNDLQTRTVRMIAPFKEDLIVNTIQKSSNNESITLSVTARLNSQSASSIQYTVILYKNGNIEFYYGNMNYNGKAGISAISRGDAIIFSETPASESAAGDYANHNFRFIPPPKIEGLSLSSTGILSGITTQSFNNLPVAVTCWDNNDILEHKTLSIKSIYPSSLIITSITVDASGDDIINVGDTVFLSFKIKNIDSVAYHNCSLNFSIFDENVNMLDASEYFGYIAPGNEYTLNNAISFAVSNTTPDEYILDFISNISSDGYLFSANYGFVVYASKIEVVDFYLRDNNDCLLDPDEETSLYIILGNNGDEAVQNISLNLRIDDPAISVSPVTGTIIPSLMPGAESNVHYILLPSNLFIEGSTVDAMLDIYIHNNFSKTIIFTIVGEKNCEDFESESNIIINHTDANWGLSPVYYSGQHAYESATITHNQTSTMSISAYTGTDGNISFYRKISTETNYDFLNFYIDTVLQIRWSGTLEWAQISFPVLAGQHTFKWVYEKDYSVNSGLDKVFIDEICFPSGNAALPNITISPDAIEVQIPQYTSLDTTLFFQSTTPVYLLFTNTILNSNNSPVNWTTVDYANGSVNALATKEVTLTFNANNKIVGETYEATLTCNVNSGNSVMIPLSMTVLPPVSVNEFSLNPDVKIYPNPASDYIFIELEKQFGTSGYIRLSDITGKLLKKEYLNESFNKIDLSSFVPGIYIIQINIENQPARSCKIVKF